MGRKVPLKAVEPDAGVGAGKRCWRGKLDIRPAKKKGGGGSLSARDGTLGGENSSPMCLKGVPVMGCGGGGGRPLAHGGARPKGGTLNPPDS